MIYSESEATNGVSALKELIEMNPSRPEAYIVLWEYYYHELFDFSRAGEIASEGFLNLNDSEHGAFHSLFTCFCAQTYIVTRKVSSALSLLRNKFIETPRYAVFALKYAKYSIKYQNIVPLKVSIGILHECLRICHKKRHGSITYWLSLAYLLNNQPIDSFLVMKEALELLRNTKTQKYKEILFRVTKLNSLFLTVSYIETALKNGRTENIKALCEEIKEKHGCLGDILLAELLWTEGMHKQSLNLLMNCIKNFPDNLRTFNKIVEYIKLHEDLNSAIHYMKNLITLCKKTQIPANIVAKVILLYCKLLSKNNQPEQAIESLKSLAELYYPYSYEGAPYTFNLHENSLVEKTKNERVIESFESQSLELSSDEDINGESGTFMLEDFIQPTDDTFIIRFPSLAEEPNENYFEQFTKFNLVFIANPHFLYAIAKISNLHSVLIEDGLSAITDYLVFLKYEMNHLEHKRLRLKGESLKGMLMMKTENKQEGERLLKELLPSLQSANMQNQRNLVTELANAN